MRRGCIRIWTAVLGLSVLVISGCTSGGGAPAGAKGAGALSARVGRHCTVQFRRNLLGAASNAPVSATYAGEANGVTYCVSGKLSRVTEDWVVIGGDEWEQWVPRETILLLDFRP